MANLSSLALALSLCACLTACAAPGPEITASQSAVVNGTVDEGHPAVVFVASGGGGCTASIIAPRVVLLARHCVESGGRRFPASSFSVQAGTNARTSPTSVYQVSEVRAVEGPGLESRAPNDVAILILSTDARETPMALSRNPPEDLLGQPTTAVGYGLRPDSTTSVGIKYTADSVLERVGMGFFWVNASVCQGDSGGPLLGPDGLVWGVASFVYPTGGATMAICGNDPGAYNELYRHLDFIDEALRDTGACGPDAVELCNGIDDNCDGQTDEGCIPLGQACSTDDECFGGACADTPAGRLCASTCDGMSADGCDDGFYCASSTNCQGYCVPGERGGSPTDADCSVDTDCASLRCLDPGDGRMRCLQGCRGDGGFCLDGQVCAAAAGTCGGCVPNDLLRMGRGLGERCTADGGECRSELTCNGIAGFFECTSACASGAECGAGFECREGLCISDRRGPLGSVCLDQADCIDSQCATQGARAWCTAGCSSSAECPAGFECAPEGLCAPMLALDGESCDGNETCASGLCAALPDGRSLCTRLCGVHDLCGRGIDCVPTSDGAAAVCVPPVPVDGEGCSVGQGASSGAGAGWLLSVLVALALWRRRR